MTRSARVLPALKGKPMTVLPSPPDPYLKPLPQITEFNRPFFEAVNDHRFVVPRCEECGRFNWIPYPACRTCLSDELVWTEVSGQATLYTFSVVHRGPGAYDASVPYIVAMGELAEGPCLVLATLVGSAPDSLRIGRRLQIAYQDIPSEETTVYHWVAVPANSAAEDRWAVSLGTPAGVRNAVDERY